ncbi:MAG: transglycosylase domain-containing protein [Myxococcaceae bacterium]
MRPALKFPTNAPAPKPPTAAPQPPSSSSVRRRARRKRRRERRLRRAALAALLAVVLVLGSHLALNSAWVRERLQAKVESALSARLGEVELGSGTGVDWTFRVAFGPVRIAPVPGQGVVLEVERVRVRPAWSALLAGRLEPGVVQLQTVTLRPGEHLAGLEALAARIQARAHSAASPDAAAPQGSTRIPRMEVRDLRVDMVSSADGKPLELGTWDAQLEVTGGSGARVVELALQRQGGGELRSLARMGKDVPVQLEAWLTLMPLEPVVEVLGHRMGLRATAGTLSGHLTGQLPADLRRGEAKVEGHLDGLVLEGKRLSTEPVGPWRLSMTGVLDFERQTREIHLREGHIAFGDNDSLRVGVEGVYEGHAGGPTFRAEAKVDQLRYQDAVDALPPQLSLGDEAPRIPGLLDARVRISGPVHEPERWAVEAKLDLTGLRAASKNVPFFLRGPFIYHPVDALGRTRELWVGPKNPSFVSFEELPRYVGRAITTSEDAGFWYHPGFDFDELKESLIDAAEGSRVRGASTLTQQLAKNLFLSRERTYARKVREALFTLALEAALPKSRLLEIYLNIIEWGPNLYGIGEASRHYFGVPARNLSIQQAVFLATIIPNPVKYHALFERGALTGSWERRTRDLISKMRGAGWISVAEATEAEYAPLHFRRP